jgi:DNA-binding NarL/FixJ family response regulator
MSPCVGTATLARVITVMLVEHPRPMLRVLRESLAGQADLRIVGEAGTLDRALMLARRRRPDVLVLDAEIPGLDPVSATRALRQQTPEGAIVVISIEPDRLRPVISGDDRALAIGKIEGADALLNAIRRLGSTGPG